MQSSADFAHLGLFCIHAGSAFRLRHGSEGEMSLSEEMRKEAKFYRKNRAFTLDEAQLEEWAGKAEVLERTNE